MFVVWIAGAVANPNRGWLAVLGGVVGTLAAPLVALGLGLWARRHGSRSGSVVAVVAGVVVVVLTVWMGLGGWGA